MKWLRNILKGASLTAALFVFQACYGTGPATTPPYEEDEVVETKAEEGTDVTAVTGEEVLSDEGEGEKAK